MRPTQQVSPNRRTHIQFDVPEPVLIQRGYWRHRYPKDMATSKASVQFRVVRRGELCWQLATYQEDLSNLHEQSAHQNAILRPGSNYQTPEGWVEKNIHRDSSDLPNSLLGSSGIATSGDPFIQKEVAAGDNWDDPKYRMDGDQSSYPGDTEGATIAMDRTVVGLVPDNTADQLTIRFSVAGGHLSAKNLLIRKYFTAPPSSWSAFGGKGYYCLLIYGDGSCRIKQLSDEYALDGSVLTSNKWVDVIATFRFAPPNQVAGRDHCISIHRHWFAPARGPLQGFVDFFTMNGVGAPNYPSIQGGILKKVGAETALAYHLACKWQRPEDPPGRSAEKLRVDVARNTRPRVQISQSKYYEDGYLFDDPLAFDVELGNGEEEDRQWYITWFGHTPPGTSIDVELYDYGVSPDEAATYSPYSSGTIGTAGAWRSFVFPETLAFPTVQVKVKLHTSDPFKTPSLYAIRITRRPIIEVTEAEPFEISGLDGATEMQIIGPDKDVTHESASFTVYDLDGSYERLRRRGSLPVEISTEYESEIDWSDPANNVYRSVIFRGYAESPRTTYHGIKDPLDRPRNSSDDLRAYGLTCYGMHIRGSQQFSVQQVDFGWARDEDIAADKPQLPWKATDVIKYALRSMGFPDENIDLPDLEVRVFPNDSEGVRVQPGQYWIEVATAIAHDYLGASLVFDANAAQSSDTSTWWGMWRLTFQPRLSVTRPLFYLAIQNPGGGAPGGWVPAADSLAWPPIEYEERTIPGTFVSKIAKEMIVDPPVSNHITVVGGSLGEGDSRAMCVAANPASYKAVRGQDAPDPDGEDYVGHQKPLYYVDSQISSESSEFTRRVISFITARLYSNLAHARKTLPVVAPLMLITDEEDELQRRPRPPRFGDEIVFFDKVGTPYKAYILNCNPTYIKDLQQMAMYEIFFPPATAQDIEI